MLTYIKKNKKLAILSVIFFLIQLPFLDQLSLLRGERDIMLSGYSLAKTGADLYGKFLSLEFLGIDPYVPFVPMYVAALWWLVMPIKTVFTARLLFVIISISLPFLIHEIVKHMTGNKKAAFWSALVFVFSPGVFHLTRLTLEIGVAFPLLLGGILAFLKKRKVLSYLLMFGAFFSYHGFRPLVPVLLVYLSFFEQRIEKGKFSSFIRQSIMHIVFFAALFGLSIFIDGRLMQSRINDVALSGFGKWSNEVIYRRNTSQLPKIVSAVFDNKATAMGQYMRDVFVNGIDLNYLFLKGDDSSLYATTFTGQFFLTLAAFYILGLFYLAKQGKPSHYYLALIIFIGLVPSVVNISYISYSIRSILSSVGHAFIIGCGILLFTEWFAGKKELIKKGVLIFVLGLIAVELAYFAYNYYGRRVITMSEMFFESERQVAQYMIRNKRPYKIYTHVPRDVFFSYLFFNNNINMKEAQAAAREGVPYRIDGFEIYVCPVNPRFTLRNEMIMDTCLTESQYEKVAIEKKYNDVIPYTNYSFKNAYFIFN